MDFPSRKPNRLPDFNYSNPGIYFLTICVIGKQCLLANIVGGGALDAPQVHLTKLGRIVEKYILSGNKIPNVCVDTYVIMPNHIHILISIGAANGAPGSSRPTVSQIISALKRFTNKETGQKLWQTSFYDHVIRDEHDYLVRWQYIDDNPARWVDDEYYHGHA